MVATEVSVSKSIRESQRDVWIEFNHFRQSLGWLLDVGRRVVIQGLQHQDRACALLPVLLPHLLIPAA